MKTEKTIKQLKKDLDAVFSIYVRYRDATENGYCRCVTCNKIDLIPNMQCGHFQSRRYLPIRWDEHNTAVQCVSCNIFDQGRQYEMGQYLERRYGKENIETLLIKKNNTCKMDKFKYLTLIEIYTNKLKKLK